MSAPAALRRAAVVLTVSLALAGGAASSASADPDDIPLRAEVTSGGGAGGAGVPGTGGLGVGGRSAGSGVVDADPGAPAAVADQTDASSSEKDDGVTGVVTVSGVRTTFHPSVDPTEGTLEAHLSVVNQSDEPITVAVRFWLTNVFGGVLSDSPERTLVSLQPGQVGVADAVLPAVGQWTVVTVHATVTPPDEVAGVPVEPIEREAWRFAAPWLVLVGITLAAAGLAVWRWSRSGADRVLSRAAARSVS